MNTFATIERSTEDLQSYVTTSLSKKGSDLDGFFFKPENIGWLLVIKGYFDETFDERSGSVWVAGHCGDEAAWTQYVDAWKESLGQRKQLHMADLRWKRVYEKELLSRLGPIPRKNGLRPVIGGVHTGDIADLIAGTRLEHYANGYVLSVVDVTTQALLGVPDGEHLEVVFEDRDQTRKHANDALFAMHLMGYFAKADARLVNSDGSVKLAKYGFMVKSGTVLFDQADYLCYALLQRYRNPNSQKAEWCLPILERVEITGNCGLMERDSARDALQRTLEAPE